MPSPICTLQLRVRYSETDQMGTFYYANALTWFEVARSELLRSCGIPYSEVERRGFYMPVAESYVKYLGRAHYDDLLTITVSGAMPSRARVRCDVKIIHADGGAGVAEGFTIHAVIDARGKPVRPPDWLVAAFGGVGGTNDVVGGKVIK